MQMEQVEKVELRRFKNAFGLKNHSQQPRKSVTVQKECKLHKLKYFNIWT